MSYGLRASITVLCMCAALNLSERAAQAQAFTIGSNFRGSTLGVDSNFVPPDSNGAVGINSFVELINGHYNVYDKGTGARTQSMADTTFWGNAGVNLAGVQSSDPRILFDHASNRWFASSIDVPNGGNAPNNFLLAVSKTSDPTQGWKGIRIAGDTSGSNNFADFPTLGINGDGVYLGANMFSTTGTQRDAGQTLISIPKADLLGATPSAANASRFQNLTDPAYGAIFQPAQDLAGGTGQEAVLAVFDPTHTSNQLQRSDVTNANTASALFAPTASIAVNSYSQPPDAQQKGTATRITTNDSRLSARIDKVGNSLWVTHSILINGNAGIRWYQIDATTSKLLQQGEFSDPNLDFYYPSIAANSAGNVVIGFTGSGANQFASSYAVVGVTIGGVTSFSAPKLLQAGQGSYSRSGNGIIRWGDYSATTLDPTNPNSFWTIQEFASATDIWSTQVTNVQIAPVPEASLIVSMVLGSGWITLITRRGRGKRRRPN